MDDHLTFEDQLKQHQAAAKTAILAQCDRLATAGILSSLHTSMDRAMTE